MAELNWAKNITYRPATITRPNKLDDLRRIVAKAPKVHALGTRHTFNDIADSAMLVSLELLENPIEIDRDAMTATVGAATRYGILAREIDRAGLALHNMGSLPHISVGGATATSTHGSGDRNRNLSSAVRAIELVTSDGDLMTVTRDDPDFAGMVVHLGALGVVTRLTFDLQPRYEVCQDVSEGLSWDVITTSFDDVFGSAYSVSIFTNYAEDDAVLWRKHRINQTGDPRSVTHWNARPAMANRHPVKDLSEIGCTPQMFEPGPWFERLPHFLLDHVPASGSEIQTEYMVAREKAVEAINALRQFEPRMRDLLMIAEIRTIAADDLWLSTAFQRDTVAFHFSWYLDQAGVDALQPELEVVLAPFDPRPHWGKTFAFDAEAIDEKFERAASFRELRRRLDPRGAFVNAFIERVGLV